MNRMALKILSELRGESPQVDAAIDALAIIGMPRRIHLKGGSAKILDLDAGTPGVISIRSQAGANVLHFGDLTMSQAKDLHAFLGVVIAANSTDPTETP